jgi:hypothetical protein
VLLEEPPYFAYIPLMERTPHACMCDYVLYLFLSLPQAQNENIMEETTSSGGRIGGG